MYGRFEYTTDLQYKVKSLQSQVDEFKSGKKYVRMRTVFKEQLNEKERVINGLKKELAKAHAETSEVRKYWFSGVDDLEEEQARELREKEKQIEAWKERAFRAEGLCDELRDELKRKTEKFYEVGVELEEEKGRNKKLMAQLSRDYENSSLPSSLKPNHKKIANNREKTDKKPGGQPGHKGYTRKKHVPTSIIHIPPPEEYINSPNFKPTGKMITKQSVNLNVTVHTCEYVTEEFRNVLTGQRVHAKFPGGVINDVNYGGSVKAFAFLLNNECNVSIDKTKKFLSAITDGTLNLSKGMINGLCKEFATKTSSAQSKAFSDILLAPVMNIDNTNARVCGKNAYVYVCATPNIAMYFAREHKGHQGISGTPAQDYQGTIVHDHEMAFYHYGTRHQECLSHVLRYLKDSIENEPEVTWNMQMRELLREIIHYRNSLNPDEDITEAKVADFENRYTEILNTAEREYEYEPPSTYYKDGYNLYARLKSYKDNHLLFLYDKRIPADNNRSERLLRNYKRKQKQMMTFRSFNSLDYLCQSMGVLASLNSQNQNIYSIVTDIFN